MATGNSADSVHRKALLIPFDGRPVQLVSYGIKQRTEQDGSVDFYEYLPDLRQWLKDAFPEQDFYNFHISSDHAQESLRSQDPGNWGNYCLYYTTSLKLPVNQACKTIISCDLAEQRLFFRGDVILVKFQGDLGLGHDYINTPYTMADITMVLIRKLVENESLEKQLKADMEFDKALEDNKRRRPEIYQAIETGALERYRTGQLMDNDEALIAALGKYVVQFPDGSSKALLG